MTATPSREPPLPVRARLAMFWRLFAIQGSWNYEYLLGTGIGFCTEPGLRYLPGGRDGPAYREALARQSSYFNAHPYLAAVAVGALARAELDGVSPAQIERFRTALCGPLGSVGDRLVWAGWLPFCSLLALLAFGLGAGAATTLLIFLGVYNAGHIALRAWGLGVGLRHGLRVAPSLGTPVLRKGPPYVARGVSLLAGVAIPLVMRRVLSPEGSMTMSSAGRRLLALFSAPGSMAVISVADLLVAGAVATVMIRLHGRIPGWKIALAAFAGLSIYSIVT